MKNKLKIAPPHVVRRDDEVYVDLSCHLTHVHVRRTKNNGKWNKPTLSWSGGNGAETPEHTQVFRDMIDWAMRIARTLKRAPRPNLLTTDKLLYSISSQS